MKTLRFFLCVSLIITSCSIAPTADSETFLALTKSAYEVTGKHDVSKQQALSFIDTSGFSKCNILISKGVVAPNTETISVTDSYSPDYSSWLIFVDLHPRAFWAHDCISFYVNVSTGEVVSSSDRFPPTIPMDTLQCINPILSSSIHDVRTYRRDEFQATTSDSIYTNKWAVIMGGSYTDGTNSSSIFAECSEMYRMLREKYLYPEENIYVLYTDPSVTELYPNNDTDEVDYVFTPENVNIVFNELSTKMQNGDALTILVMTHGDSAGNDDSYIMLWDQTRHSDKALAMQINKISPDVSINVIMGQCFSGGFVNELMEKCSYIATACSADETSWRALDTDRSVFFLYWLEAMNSYKSPNKPSGLDSNNDGIISFGEAYVYTNNRYPDNTYAQLGIPETRQESFINVDYKERVGLLGILQADSNNNTNPEIADPILIVAGPQNLRVGNIVSYTVSNIPDGTTVAWNWPSQLRPIDEDSPNNSKTITLCANGTSVTAANLTISATYTSAGGTVTEGMSNINIWKPGINISDDLIVGNLTPSGGIVQVSQNIDGAYGYNWYNDRNWNVISQGSYIAEFTNQYRDDSQYVTVSVDFINPLGDQTTFVRTFTLNH